jgi:hypothetical protein
MLAIGETPDRSETRANRWLRLGRRSSIVLRF